MRGIPYTQASRKNQDMIPQNSFVSEALARQAANRPLKQPPKVLSACQELPKRGRQRRPVQ